MDQEILAFLEICRCKSISKAAEKLFISQSSLSTKIRILERNLGYSLFIRGKGSRSVMLTDKGEKFLGLAVKYQEILEKNVGFRSGWRKREASDIFDEQFRNSSADTCV